MMKEFSLLAELSLLHFSTHVHKTAVPDEIPSICCFLDLEKDVGQTPSPGRLYLSTSLHNA